MSRKDEISKGSYIRLQRSADDIAILPEHTDERRPEAENAPTTWQAEAQYISANGVPMALACLLEYSLSTTTLITVGRLGTIELGAASLASMTANMTAYMVYYGLATSMDTLCAQAYGAGMTHLVSVHFQRMVCFLYIVTVPIIVLWSVADKILPNVIRHEETAVLAGRYLQVAAFGTPAYVAFECGRRYLQAQGVYSGSMYVLMICVPFNAFMTWFLVWYCNMGFIGAPVALTITDNLLPWCLLLYAYWGKRDKCWHGFTRQALHGWGPMIRLAIPGFLTAEAESLTWAINTAIASYLGPDALAAQTILSNIVHIAWQISYALSNSTRVRSGNWIGAGNEYAARTASKAALYVALTSGVAIMAFLLASRDYIVRTFTTDAGVIDLVLGIIPLCGVAQLCEASSMVAGAVLCGIGRPHVTSAVQGLAFLVTLPTILGTVFGLGWHIYGLWVAAILGPLCAACVEWVFLRGVSWKACIDDGMKSLGV
ncbi:hypothetical protein HFD88_005698 [Aspergillus terreus]|nr:hypothetical protein HFD88_005698 [Aspergillus terreus]